MFFSFDMKKRMISIPISKYQVFLFIKFKIKNNVDAFTQTTDKYKQTVSSNNIQTTLVYELKYFLYIFAYKNIWFL